MSEQVYHLCQTGKRCLSRREACETIADAKRYNHCGHKKRIPKRAYRCPICGTWHTTSQPVRDKGEYGYRKV